MNYMNYINVEIPGLKYNYLVDNTNDDIVTTFYSHLKEADEYVEKKNSWKMFSFTFHKNTNGQSDT